MHTKCLTCSAAILKAQTPFCHLSAASRLMALGPNVDMRIDLTPAALMPGAPSPLRMAVRHDGQIINEELEQEQGDEETDTQPLPAPVPSRTKGKDSEDEPIQVVQPSGGDSFLQATIESILHSHKQEEKQEDESFVKFAADPRQCSDEFPFAFRNGLMCCNKPLDDRKLTLEWNSQRCDGNVRTCKDDTGAPICRSKGCQCPEGGSQIRTREVLVQGDECGPTTTTTTTAAVIEKKSATPLPSASVPSRGTLNGFVVLLAALALAVTTQSSFVGVSSLRHK
uniref:Uncharacterized protein n=1 Tax=Chromera velia CCMP2878 TaxID=1169474 RepID=A0A0G4GWR5_9ALVE|eukprot:Cvel_23679.t1-p1 / transcript=Cvel_23679.t1 / gene=Cvel_23679 / organism=Chromera_velia_CCMP2878 / gene_product=hypothetical protein / transcript_product=hypothetical protein / location=Cvel_scaffold2468:15143-20184(+) / protein_length=281 / sequence_SO=supercontig / SO=protein_coding / is_pseudo=false